MSFGKTIKDLRRKHNMTQERLAEILSISPQAISRWETDVAMPDISLIAPLCNLFNITSDELLGIDLTRRQQIISSICDEANKYSSRGYLEKAREILEDGLRKYPDNCDIICNLMYVSSWQKDVTGDRKYLEEAIKWGEKAFYYAKKDSCKKALHHLSLAAEHAVKFVTSVNEDCTSLVFRGMYRGSWCTSSSENEALRLLKKIESKTFDKIRDKEEFSNIKKRLLEYSDNWTTE